MLHHVSNIIVSYFAKLCLLHAGRDSSGGVTTRYGLDGRGSNPGAVEISRTRPDRPCCPPSLLCNGYRVSFPGLKRPGRGVDDPPPCSAEVKERKELHIYSPSRPSWPVLGRTLLATWIMQLQKTG